jgi:hypothetical protein
MIDLTNEIDRKRYHAAEQNSRDAMQPWRDSRTGMLRQYVGSAYGIMGPHLTTYVNNLNRTANIYSMALAFNNPQVKVNSFDQKLWPECRKWEVNINKVIANISINFAFQECLLDAFFLMGVGKTRMAEDEEREIFPDVWIDPGKPWFNRVSFDDLILDLPARNCREFRFIGDRYRCSLDGVRKRDDYESKVVRKLGATSKFTYDAGSNYASEIANGQRVDDDDLEPMCWLKDVYFPKTKEFVTFSADNLDLPPLKVDKSDEGDYGPYDLMYFGIVPDNPLPTTPAQQLIALDLLMNRLYRKMARQADRQKNALGYTPGGDDDAKRAKDVVDGGTFMVRDKNSILPVNFPGVDANTNQFFMAAAEVYNTQAGNERAIGGLGDEAETLGQEEIIQTRAGGRIGYMKGQVNAFASSVCRKIGCLMYDDDSLTIESSLPAENTSYRVDSSWRPGERKGLKDQYEFSVEPNSMPWRPVDWKVKAVFNYLNTIAPIFPMVQAGILDIQELTKIVAEYENLPELERIFSFMAQPGQGPADPHQASKSPVTSREVVRKNVNRGPQGQGMSQVLAQMMQRGGNQQQGVLVGG